MATSYTSLLGLALPVTGELSGTWGDTVNNSITSLLDTAVAGTTTLSTDSDVTLSTTTGVANQARQAIILWTANGSTTRNITAPAQSKIYTVINASAGTQSIVFRGAGPTTGVTIVKGESALVAWNGTDFIKISNTGGAASFTNVTVSGTTTLSGLTASTALALNASKEVVSVTNTGTGNNVLSASPTLTGTLAAAAATFSGAVTLGDAAADNITVNGTVTSNLIFTDNTYDIGASGATRPRNLYLAGDATIGGSIAATTLDLTNLEVTNIKAKDGTASITLADSTGVASFTANPVLSGGTANGVAYLNGSKVLTTGSALTFDGTTVGIQISGRALNIGTTTAANFYTAYRYNSADIAYVGNGPAVIAGTAATDFAIGTNGAGTSLIFGINNAEQMRLTSTGLGIGTSSPGYKLDVNGEFRQTGSNIWFGGGVRLSGDATGNVDVGYNYGSAAKFTWYMGGTTAKMLLDSSGNLGLGVTPSAWGSPFVALQVSRAGLRGSTDAMGLSYNAYYDGSGFKYIASSRYATDYYQNSGQHVWSVAPTGTAGNAITFTQAMTLDASGRLLIGGTSTYDFNGQANLVVNGTANNATITIASTGIGYLAFADGTSGTDRYAGRIDYDHASDFMAFSTAATERARITSGGYFKASYNGSFIGASSNYHELIGGAGGDWMLRARNTAGTAPYGIQIEYNSASPNNTGSEFIYCQDSGPTQRMAVRSNGGIANYSANDVNLSDRREKTNFAPAKSYLDVICAIPVQTFNYIDQNLEEDDGLTLGVVAQDVQAVAPELVMESNWGTEDEPKMRLSVYQTDLQYALMKALQELKEQNDELRARVSALEAK